MRRSSTFIAYGVILGIMVQLFAPAMAFAADSAHASDALIASSEVTSFIDTAQQAVQDFIAVPDSTETAESGSSEDLTESLNLTGTLDTVSNKAQYDGTSFQGFSHPEVIPSTGALRYSYPINVPPGRNGMQPDLALVYDSHDTRDNSIVAKGWNLNIPYIEKFHRTGTDDLHTGGRERYRSSIDGELVHLGNDEYGAKNETGSFMKYKDMGTHWVVTDKLGTKYTYGQDLGGGDARIHDSQDLGFTYRWMLTRIEDTHDNYVWYTYEEDGNTSQIYIKEIHYTQSTGLAPEYKISFTWESRAENYITYDYGFKLSTQQRLKTIEIRHDNDLVRKYDLQYVVGDNGYRSMLDRITETGYDENGTPSSLPPTTFFHAISSSKGWSSAPNVIPNVTLLDTATNTDNGTRILDLNGDALADIVTASDNFGSDVKTIRKNNGDGTWSNVSSFTLPVYIVRKGADGVAVDNGVRFVDVDGDGLVDILQAYQELGGGPTVRKVFINQGDFVWAEDTNYVLPVDFVHVNPTDDDYFPSRDQGVRLTDMNGDELIDIIFDNGGLAYVNEGDGTGWGTSESTNILWDFIDENNSYLDLGIRFADANNDGLVDVFQLFTDDNQVRHRTVRENTGRSFWSSTSDLGLVPPLTVTSHFTEDNPGVRMTDINGDGSIDFVQSAIINSNQVKQVYLYSTFGNGWENADTGYQIPTLFAGGTGYESIDTRLVDVDGDGLDDIVAQEAGTVVFYKASAGNNVDLLTQITHSTGGVTSINYEASGQMRTAGGNIANPDLPYPIIAVERITHSNGMGVFSNDYFDYEGGDVYYEDEFNRNFAGFEKVTVDSLETGKKTVSYFHQGNGNNASYGERYDHKSNIGKMYKQEIIDGQNAVRKITYTDWETSTLSGPDQYFVRRTNDTTFDYNSTGSFYRTKATRHDYDLDNGNVIVRTEFGRVSGDPSDGTFVYQGSNRRIWRYTYADDPTNNAVIGLPSLETLEDQNGVVVRKIRHYYDNLPHGQAVEGDETKTQHWRDTTNTYIDTAINTYGGYGELLTSTNARGKTTTYSYDSQKQFPTTITNHLGHATQYTYDYTSGAVKRTTDPNGLVTEMVYDGLDRVIEEKTSNQAQSNLVTRATHTYTSSGSLPRKVHTHTYHTEDINPSQRYSYVDGFGREIQTRVLAPDTPNGDENDSPSWWDVTSTEYDAQGRVHKQYIPVRKVGSSYNGTGQNDTQATVIAYDVLDRPISYTSSLGTQTIDHDEWTQTVVDTNNNTTVYIYDGHGRLDQVDEHNDTFGYSTYYIYDSMDNLKRITDGDINDRQFTYDSLGRLLSSELPQASGGPSLTHTYGYDDNHNMVSHTYPDGKTVSYSYDDLDRLETINDPLTPLTEIQYTYDSATDGIGKLATISTVEGDSQTYAYDGLGNVKSITRTTVDALSSGAGGLNDQELVQDQTFTNGVTDIIKAGINIIAAGLNGSNDPTTTIIEPGADVTFEAGQRIELQPGFHAQPGSDFHALINPDVTGDEEPDQPHVGTTHYTYDDFGALTDITYPGGEVQTHIYDIAGRLEKLEKDGTNIISDFDYSPHGPVTSMRFTVSGPSVYQITTYDPNRQYQLATYKLSTDPNNADPTAHYINATYTFDGEGNLTDLVDTGWEKPRTYSFEYDDLNRLTQANIEYRGVQESRAYNYSPTGNILHKGDVGTYAYDDNRHPQAVTSTTGWEEYTFTYDTNGNVATELRPNGDTLTYAYDFMDRLASIDLNGTIHEYRYLDGTDRIQERHGSNVVSYLGPEAEIDQGGDYTTYYMAHGGRLAYEEPQYGLRQIHQDYLGSTSIITDNQGGREARYEHYPFGDTRDSLRLQTAAPNHTFTDQIDDAQTGLLYFGARYYHPVIGRFLSVDPIVITGAQRLVDDPQSFNTFAYARNNPLAYVDPTGNFSIKNTLKKMADVVDQGFKDLNNVLTFGTYDIAMNAMERAIAKSAQDGFSLKGLANAAVVEPIKATAKIGTGAALFGATAASGVGAVSGSVGGAILTGAGIGSTIHGAPTAFVDLWDNPTATSKERVAAGAQVGLGLLSIPATHYAKTVPSMMHIDKQLEITTLGLDVLGAANIQRTSSQRPTSGYGYSFVDGDAALRDIQAQLNTIQQQVNQLWQQKYGY